MTVSYLAVSPKSHSLQPAQSQSPSETIFALREMAGYNETGHSP
jgi:hypothetical protein